LAAAADLPAFERNARFADAGRAFTDKKYPLFYNNFYEFGFSKGDPARNSKGFSLDPYTLEIDGLVERPVKLGLDDTEIKPEAKYVAFKSFYDPERAPGQRQKVYDWPYHEGLRLDEAMNELTLAVTGLYGKRLVPQSGTPLRIIIPWKYGFKGPKSVVKMTLVADQPPTLWNTAQPSEYKFYSNVDPRVPHPRWSQAMEKLLGDEVVEVPTQWYNGYGDYVAHLYETMPRELY
jgi:sulfoxide reductase catalytic subunit YedY